MLADRYEVTNLSRAGVGEYKIYRQLAPTDFDDYDVIIVCHTSPYRVHTRKHPIHGDSSFHAMADLIYSDIEYHRSKILSFINRSLTAAWHYFKYHYDLDYQEFIYCATRDKINDLLLERSVIHIDTALVPEKFRTGNFDISDINIRPGEANHLSREDNIKVFELLNERIEEISKDSNSRI